MADNETRHALRLCVEQMCARCREAADALTSSVPCLEGCETLKIAKAALATPQRNCWRFDSCAEAKAEWWKTEVMPRVYGVVSGAEPPFMDWLYFITEKEGGNDGRK